MLLQFNFLLKVNGEETFFLNSLSGWHLQGIFGIIMKDTKGSKAKESDANNNEQFMATTSEVLASIFSSANFTPPSVIRNSSLKDDENIDLDDIGIEDNTQKQKGPHFPGLSKRKISKGFQALRGKLKPKTEEKVNSGDKKPEVELPVRQVDQIKMKYGYATSNCSKIDREQATGEKSWRALIFDLQIWLTALSPSRQWRKSCCEPRRTRRAHHSNGRLSCYNQFLLSSGCKVLF